MMRISEHLKALAQKGKTILIITHDYEFAAMTCNRVLHFVDEGHAETFPCKETSLGYILASCVSSCVSEWIDMPCMEWQNHKILFMIIGGLEDSNPPITGKEPCFMEKQKNGELSRMFGYAGNYHVLTVLGCILSGISTILSMLPFVCIWLVIRDLIQAFAAGDISLATESTRYAWMAVVFAAASILIYFIALNCTHLAAFRTATNMRKTAIHHIVTLPLGYFSQNASGRLRKIIDDNAGLTEGFLAHQLPDLTGAVVMPVAVIVLIFLLTGG